MATILLVDDRPINRQFLTTLLGYGGHHLLEASDGAEALSVIMNERPDLIITDILMPTMNGYELVQRLRADPQLADIDVIFYTATYRSSEARLLADACGVKHVLAKPSEPQLILETVNAVLGVEAPDLLRPPEPLSIEQPFTEAVQQTVAYVENKLSDYLNDLQTVNAQLVSLIGRGAELVIERDRLLRLSDQFSKNIADLQAINLKLGALSEFNFNLTAERNPDLILEMLCGAAFKIIGASYVAVGLLDIKEELPQNVYTKGSEPSTAVSPEWIDEVMRKNRPVRLGTFMGVPLSSAVQIYGLVTLHGKEFSKEDEQFAVTLVAEAAIAYENARLYETIQSHAAKLQLEVTERKRAEEALLASEQRFRALIENAPDGIALLDIDGKLQQITPSTERILGYTHREARNQDLAMLTHREDYPDLLILLNDLLQHPGKVVTTQYRFQHKDGSWRWLESTISNLIAEPSVEALVFNYRDITERKQAEEALRERDALLNRSQAMAHVGSWELDLNANRLTWSDEVYRIFGLGIQEFAATYEAFLEVVHPEDRAAVDEAYSRSVREGHDTYEIEHRIIRRDSGEVRFVHEKCEHVKETTGRIVRSIGMVQDITERKRAEETLQTKNEEIKLMTQQLWQSAKLATMGELAASIAHELNNPLATVSLRTEMLLNQHLPDLPESRSLLIIDSEVKRMSALVANLLQYSRRSPRQVSTVDVHKEIIGTLELVHYHFQKHNIQTVREFSRGALMVQADRQQLQQVFLNLFTNAADAMPQGGTLIIRTLAGDKSAPALATSEDPRSRTTTSLGLPVSKLPQVLVEVIDTGEGIAPENLDQVWDPFYTTKPEGQGTGLGLAICRRIIQEHGGTIEVASEGITGKGTVVRIALPAVKGE